MAKGQQRSNREIRKPKKQKAAAKPESTFGSQIKLAANANAPGGKDKR
ncbi:hypothetical protein [Mesorhizobium sp. ZC-5]|jgi:hypothetical protein|nr:hypothetical protein [Mesorhizobium sp. ZC-5]MCV3242852.1 hypothetical protein [Mesorhizobium sp. ZC-5]